ncbi:MAG: hypothetical protein PVJ09_01055 [Candidatus Woesebacteria bacterium]|jgi:hypothetical protein
MKIKQLTISSYYLILLGATLLQILSSVFRLSQTIISSSTLAALEQEKESLAKKENELKLELSQKISLAKNQNEEENDYQIIGQVILINTDKKLASNN